MPTQARPCCPDRHGSQRDRGPDQGRTIFLDGPSRMVKRPTGSGGEPSSPNCGVSAGVKARHLIHRSARSAKGVQQHTARVANDMSSAQCAQPAKYKASTTVTAKTSSLNTRPPTPELPGSLEALWAFEPKGAGMVLAGPSWDGMVFSWSILRVASYLFVTPRGWILSAHATRANRAKCRCHTVWRWRGSRGEPTTVVIITREPMTVAISTRCPGGAPHPAPRPGHWPSQR